MHYLFGGFNIKNVENVEGKIIVSGHTDKQEFNIEVAWEYPYIRREWILKKGVEEIKLNFLEDKIIYPQNKIKHSDNKDKLECMINEFLKFPKFDSSYRALEILSQFEKNKITV